MRSIFTGIDIGTYHVKVVIAASPETPDQPLQILGTGSAASKGMRHGYIVDTKELARSVREAIGRASQASGVKVRRAWVGVGGVSLEECRSTGDVTLTASGGLVTARDIARALEESRKKAGPKLINRHVLDTIPLEYRIDGVRMPRKPLHLQGTRLSVDTLIITTLQQHQEDIIEAIEMAGIEVDGIMAAPLAASEVTLTKAQRTAGVVLANIGAETLSIIVYDDDLPVSLKVFPIGSSDITGSIALSFQIPLSEAEQMKHGAVTGSDIPQRKMNTVISGRLKEMFMLINAHLKTINRQRLLPAGIVLTGGGSGVAEVSDIARAILRLPSQVGHAGIIPRLGTLDGTWAVAFGLCRAAFTEESEAGSRPFSDVLRRTGETLSGMIRSLLP